VDEVRAQLTAEIRNDSTLTTEEQEREIEALLAGEDLLEPEEIG
jgi:hypothetical protein